MAAGKEQFRKDGGTEIPEKVFRSSAAFGELVAIKAEQKAKARAEFRARWPLSYVVKTGAVWLGPWIALAAVYWLSGYGTR